MAKVYTLVLLVLTVEWSTSLDNCGPRDAETLSVSVYNATSDLSVCVSSKLTGANLNALNLSSMQITAANLTHLHNLLSLDLTNNSITNLTNLHVPSQLYSLNLTLNKLIIDKNITFPLNITDLNMSNNNITINSDVHLFGKLKRLDLRHNRITSTEPIANLTQLEELRLADNNITKLNDRTFSRLTSLVLLDLSNNRIAELSGKTFIGLCRLQTLDLSDNLVLTMEPGTFQYTDNLISLKLRGNVMIGRFVMQRNSMLIETGQRLQTIDVTETNITEIPVILTRSVRNLLVAENNIATIRRGDLDSYPLLQMLNLSRNAITTVEDDALGRLEFLTELYLSHNLLKIIPRVLPDTLILFDMKNNKIESLTSGDFTGLTRLRQLTLSWNAIRAVNEETFGQLSSLELLDLSGNPIKTLSSDVFIGPRRLKRLILTRLHDLLPTPEPLSFPVPESGHLESLDLTSSPVLAEQLLEDVAALTMLRQLFELNLSNTNLTQIRSDLFRFLPRLKILNLNGNILNCTNIFWLSVWYRDDADEDIALQDLQERGSVSKRTHLENCASESEPICSFPTNLEGRSVYNLSEIDFPEMSYTKEMSTTQTTFSAATEIYTFTSASTTNNEHYSTTVTFDSNKTENTTNKQPTRSALNKSVQNKTPDKTRPVSHRTLVPIPEQTEVISTSKTVIDNQFVKLTLNKNTSVLVVPSETSRDAGKMDAFSAQPAAGSHPGMFVFLTVLCVLVFASVIMVVSHWTQYRKRKQLTRGYVQQQDIEVQSLSSAAINDLW